jgi:hypothetical protein
MAVGIIYSQSIYRSSKTDQNLIFRLAIWLKCDQVAILAPLGHLFLILAQALQNHAYDVFNANIWAVEFTGSTKMTYLKTTFVCAVMVISAPAFGPAFATTTHSPSIFGDHARVQPWRHKPVPAATAIELKEGAKPAAQLSTSPASVNATQASSSPQQSIEGNDLANQEIPKGEFENTHEALASTATQQSLRRAYDDHRAAGSSFAQARFSLAEARAAATGPDTTTQLGVAMDYTQNSNRHFERGEERTELNASRPVAHAIELAQSGSTNRNSPTSAPTTVAVNPEPSSSAIHVNAQPHTANVSVPEIDGAQSGLAFGMLISLLVAWRERRAKHAI